MLSAKISPCLFGCLSVKRLQVRAFRPLPQRICNDLAMQLPEIQSVFFICSYRYKDEIHDVIDLKIDVYVDSAYADENSPRSMKSIVQFDLASGSLAYLYNSRHDE